VATHKLFAKRTGKLVEDADILVAAKAMKHGMVVMTDNTEHFKRIRGLKVENWLKA
jgi:tRNA(fMet)-specific endonuclease VapC